ncbi:hypothetical protein MCAG_03843 [Micromonospora sp. ATCC 39149]|uniref:hypothetical protein n=1 Tax=Micromonospora sp. (strain ATCC 39149 / NRRL 15099 / SCC 1413) TaxID=219305 RepID=UPI0001A504DE|nr:hypothetical protein [Micromonospora sp. ATCC 39149]EEP73516.1 hypothetical protein MCAG_03843 [Micromonospora sp. ATCC 39149]
MLLTDGREYGTAAEIAHALGTDITADRVRDWARRSRKADDRLYGLLPGHHLPGPGRGTTWYRLDHAAHVEWLTRTGPAGARRGVELTPTAGASDHQSHIHA